MSENSPKCTCGKTTDLWWCDGCNAWHCKEFPNCEEAEKK